MNNLTLTTQYDSDTTLISNTFIDEYMPQANGEFVKIYLYLLRSVLSRRADISVSSMADEFNQTEADVMRALKYWHKTGAIIMSFDGPGNGLSGIVFCDLTPKMTGQPEVAARGVVTDYHMQDTQVVTSAPPPRMSRQRTAPVTQTVSSASTVNISSEAVEHTPQNVSQSQKPVATTLDYVSKSEDSNVTPIVVEKKSSVKPKVNYSPAQMKELSAQEDFSLLLYAVGAYLGGTLSPSDASTIAYFYDTLNFPTDLIEYLIEYCVSKDHKSMRYIEKVAIAWAEAGIHTIKEAKREINNHSEFTYSVMNAFGIANRELGQREREFIKKWSEAYGFNLELILEACNRTLKATHQPSFEYADSILTKWKNSNVTTADDVRKADAEYEQSKVNKKSNHVVSKSANRFNNFHQRDTDIESLESSLISNNG